MYYVGIYDNIFFLNFVIFEGLRLVMYYMMRIWFNLKYFM